MSKTVGKATITLAVLQEQIRHLEADLEELISHSQPPCSNVAYPYDDEEMSVDDLTLAIASSRADHPSATPQSITDAYSERIPD